MGGANTFDWAGMLRLGLGRLGLRPAEFWALTPAEFLLMLGPPAQAGPLDGAGLAALLARFPDDTKGMTDERDGKPAGGAGGES